MLHLLPILLACSPEPAEDAAVAAFGFGQDLTVIGSADHDISAPRDLDFNPDSPGELWVVNYETDSTTTFFNAGQTDEWENRSDVFGEHFMEKVSSIAFGDPTWTNANGDVVTAFGTCQESRNTYNDRYAPNDFMGPTLWPSDMETYAAVNQDPWGDALGSHLDMLHQSPESVGIAHDSGNAYWVFDGHNGDLVYYDFAADHGAGGEDHSDGVVRRHTDVVLTRLEGVPGHMELDKATGYLYISDTGTGRVLKVDTAAAAEVGTLSQRIEYLDEYTEWNGAAVTVLAQGLSQPSGLALHDGLVFVSDHATGEIIAIDTNGAEVERIATGATAIMGLAFDPDGRLWYVDAGADTVVRVDPQEESPDDS